jgi:hypothetical protein
MGRKWFPSMHSEGIPRPIHSPIFLKCLISGNKGSGEIFKLLRGLDLEDNFEQ